MKYSEIKNLEIQELRKRLYQNKSALFEARMQHKMQRLSNLMTIQNLRRDMARLQTALFIFKRKEESLPTPSVQKKPSSVKLAPPKKQPVYPKKRIKKVEAKKPQLETVKTVKKPQLETVKTVKKPQLETIKTVRKPAEQKDVKKDVKKVSAASVREASGGKKKAGWFSFMNRLKKDKNIKSTEDSKKVEK